MFGKPETGHETLKGNYHKGRTQNSNHRNMELRKKEWYWIIFLQLYQVLSIQSKNTKQNPSITLYLVLWYMTLEHIIFTLPNCLFLFHKKEL